MLELSQKCPSRAGACACKLEGARHSLLSAGRYCMYAIILQWSECPHRTMMIILDARSRFGIISHDPKFYRVTKDTTYIQAHSRVFSISLYILLTTNTSSLVRLKRRTTHTTLPPSQHFETLESLSNVSWPELDVDDPVQSLQPYLIRQRGLGAFFPLPAARPRIWLRKAKQQPHKTRPPWTTSRPPHPPTAFMPAAELRFD